SWAGLASVDLEATCPARCQQMITGWRDCRDLGGLRNRGVRRKSGRGAQELLRRARRCIILDLILILSPAAKTLSWSNGQRRGYRYRLAVPAIIQNVNKPAIIRT
ncbi:MAG: hypothetical protein ACRDPL_01820, partial [Propionibacteriaceae bacterium]